MSAHQDAMSQYTAQNLAQLLQRLARQSHDDFDGVSITPEGGIAITQEQAALLNDSLLSVLPQCYAVGDGYPTDEACAMPDAVCHPCVAQGRRSVTGI